MAAVSGLLLFMDGMKWSLSNELVSTTTDQITYSDAFDAERIGVIESALISGVSQKSWHLL